MNKRLFRINQPRVAYFHDVVMAGLSFVIGRTRLPARFAPAVHL